MSLQHEGALLGDRSHSGEFRTVVSSGGLGNSLAAQAGLLWSVCPQIHHVWIYCRVCFHLAWE